MALFANNPRLALVFKPFMYRYIKGIYISFSALTDWEEGGIEKYYF